MAIEQLKDQIPDFAKDTRLNLASMMADETLSPQSKYGPVAGERDYDPQSDRDGRKGSGRRRCYDAGGSRGGEIRSIRHGDEHRLLPLRSSRLQSRIQDNTGSAAHEWLGNPRVDRADFELWALVVSAINRSGPAWTPMRKRCGNPVSARTQFKQPCALPLSCSQWRLRSRPHSMGRHKWRSNPPFPHLSARPSRAGPG